jgi:hypothetical protein
MPEKTSASISRLNDLLRTHGIGGKVVATPSVVSLSADTRAEVLNAIRNFDTFSEDNDPYGEHDFGSVEVSGDKFFFKIDYYDPTMERHSDNPADPSRTLRVMIIMRADEY